MNTRSRIMLVDDDPDLLKLLSIRLKSGGFDIASANSGETALAAVAANRPDVVVTDLRMPGMDGMALFDALNLSHPGLPVIVLTAHGNIPEAVEATQRGVFGYLTKPYDAQELVAHIRRAIDLSGQNASSANGTADDASWSEEILTR